MERKIVIWVLKSFRMRQRDLGFKTGFCLFHICIEEFNMVEEKPITMACEF